MGHKPSCHRRCSPSAWHPQECQPGQPGLCFSRLKAGCYSIHPIPLPSGQKHHPQPQTPAHQPPHPVHPQMFNSTWPKPRPVSLQAHPPAQLLKLKSTVALDHFPYPRTSSPQTSSVHLLQPLLTTHPDSSGLPEGSLKNALALLTQNAERHPCFAPGQGPMLKAVTSRRRGASSPVISTLILSQAHQLPPYSLIITCTFLSQSLCTGDAICCLDVFLLASPIV